MYENMCVRLWVCGYVRECECVCVCERENIFESVVCENCVSM